jgi:hypothetical protein
LISVYRGIGVGMTRTGHGRLADKPGGRSRDGRRADTSTSCATDPEVGCRSVRARGSDRHGIHRRMGERDDSRGCRCRVCRPRRSRPEGRWSETDQVRNRAGHRHRADRVGELVLAAQSGACALWGGSEDPGEVSDVSSARLFVRWATAPTIGNTAFVAAC